MSAPLHPPVLSIEIDTVSKMYSMRDIIGPQTLRESLDILLKIARIVTTSDLFLDRNKSNRSYRELGEAARYDLLLNAAKLIHRRIIIHHAKVASKHPLKQIMQCCGYNRELAAITNFKTRATALYDSITTVNFYHINRDIRKCIYDKLYLTDLLNALTGSDSLSAECFNYLIVLARKYHLIDEHTRSIRSVFLSLDSDLRFLYYMPQFKKLIVYHKPDERHIDIETSLENLKQCNAKTVREACLKRRRLSSALVLFWLAHLPPDCSSLSLVDHNILGDACNNKPISHVKLLLALKFDPNNSKAWNHAIHEERLDVLDLLIAAGGYIEGTAGQRSPMLQAASNNHARVVEYLLSKGATATRDHPLLVALRYRYQAIAALLIHALPDRNMICDRLGRTYLHKAAHEGLKEVVELLLANGANPNLADNAGATPFVSAVQEGHLGIALLLWKNGGQLPELYSQRYPFHFEVFEAIKTGKLQRVSNLIIDGIDLQISDRWGNTPFHWVAASGDFPLACLFFNRADKSLYNKENNKKATPLKLTIENGHANLTADLLRKGASLKKVNPKPVEILVDVIRKGNNELLSILLDIGKIDPNEQAFYQPLWVAIFKKNYKAASLLIRYKAKPSADPNLLAAGCEDEETLALLIKKGALIEGDGGAQSGDRTFTPLRSLMNPENWKSGELLLKAGASVASLPLEKVVNLLNPETNVPFTFLEPFLEKINFSTLIDAFKELSSEKGISINLVWCVFAHLKTPGQLDRMGELIVEKYHAMIGREPLLSLIKAIKCPSFKNQLLDKQKALWRTGDFSVWLKEITSTRDGEQHLHHIHSAAQKGEWSTVRFLVQHGVPIYLQTTEGKTPLHFAVEEGRVITMRWLLRAGASPTLPANDGSTPLHAAMRFLKDSAYFNPAYSDKAIRALETIIDCLLVEGAALECKEENGKTPLYLAAELGNLEAVNYLIQKKGAIIPTEDLAGETPLHAAVLYGAVNLVRLICRNAPKDYVVECIEKRELLHLAVAGLNVEIVKFLLPLASSRLIQGSEGAIPLHCAFAINVWYQKTFMHLRGDYRASLTEMIDLLLQETAEQQLKAKDNRGRTPLHNACLFQHHKSLLTQLRSRGADIHAEDIDGNTPMHYAASYAAATNIVGGIDLLLQQGGNIHHRNHRGHTPLYPALSSESNTEKVINAGAVLHLRDIQGYNPLSYGILSMAYGIRVLLRFAAKQSSPDERYSSLREFWFHEKDNRGFTILELLLDSTAKEYVSRFLTLEEREEQVEFLLKQGAEWDESKYGGMSVFHAIIAAGMNHLFEDLVEANPIALAKVDDQGNTLAHIAVNASNSEALDILARHGVSLDKPNVQGVTPLLLAAKSGSLKILEQCLKHLPIGVDSQDTEGNSLVHLAVSSEDIAKITYLHQQKSADLNKRNNQSKTPLDIILEKLRGAAVVTTLQMEIIEYFISNKGISRFLVGWKQSRIRVEKTPVPRKDYLGNADEFTLADRTFIRYSTQRKSLEPVQALLGEGLPIKYSRDQIVDQIEQALKSETGLAYKKFVNAIWESYSSWSMASLQGPLNRSQFGGRPPLVVGLTGYTKRYIESYLKSLRDHNYHFTMQDLELIAEVFNLPAPIFLSQKNVSLSDDIENQPIFYQEEDYAPTLSFCKVVKPNDRLSAAILAMDENTVEKLLRDNNSNLNVLNAEEMSCLDVLFDKLRQNPHCLITKELVHFVKRLREHGATSKYMEWWNEIERKLDDVKPIPKPSQVEAIQMDPPANPNKLKQLKEGDTFLYHGKTFKIEFTWGNGFCGVHALLGQNVNGRYEAKLSRIEIPKKIREALDQKNKDVLEKYSSVISHLYEEWKAKHPLDPILHELLEPIFQKFNEIKNEHEKMELCWDAYQQALNNERYYLLVFDLNLIASAYGISQPIILTQAEIERGMQGLGAPLDGDFLERKLIFHNVNHFSFCSYQGK